MERNLDKLLSKLVEEIEHIEVTREQFGEVLRRIRNKINLSKFPAVATNIIDTPSQTDEPRFAPVDEACAITRDVAQNCK